jgi:hypothetical protein
MWNPWMGKNYGKRKLLILGESCYSWINDVNEISHPSDNHPIDLVRSYLDGTNKIRFMNMITRGIAGSDRPSGSLAHVSWDSVSFTNYVPVSVGCGHGVRPTRNHWDLAKREWPDLLEKLNPSNIIVLGYEAWRNLPEPFDLFMDDVPFSDEKSVTERWRVYKTISGATVRCWSHWHPRAGASWKSIRDAIQRADLFRQ